MDNLSSTSSYLRSKLCGSSHIFHAYYQTILPVDGRPNPSDVHNRRRVARVASTGTLQPAVIQVRCLRQCLRSTAYAMSDKCGAFRCFNGIILSPFPSARCPWHAQQQTRSYKSGAVDIERFRTYFMSLIDDAGDATTGPEKDTGGGSNKNNNSEGRDVAPSASLVHKNITQQQLQEDKTVRGRWRDEHPRQLPLHAATKGHIHEEYDAVDAQDHSSDYDCRGERVARMGEGVGSTAAADKSLPIAAPRAPPWGVGGFTAGGREQLSTTTKA